MRTFFDKRRGRATKIPAMVLVMAGVVAAASVLVMLLWNWLMPALFAGVRTIDYWQALGLLLLAKILFGGGHVRGRTHQHWNGMAVEEREQLKRHFKSRWGRQFGIDGAEDTARRSAHPASADFQARDTGERGDQA
jgi:hypothetical protein